MIEVSPKSTQINRYSFEGSIVVRQNQKGISLQTVE